MWVPYEKKQMHWLWRRKVVLYWENKSCT